MVEGCQRRFRAAAERKQHLVDAHAFPPDFHFERMHVRQKHGQHRPQKPGPAEGRAAAGASNGQHQQPAGACRDLSA